MNLRSVIVLVCVLLPVSLVSGIAYWDHQLKTEVDQARLELRARFGYGPLQSPNHNWEIKGVKTDPRSTFVTAVDLIPKRVLSRLKNKNQATRIVTQTTPQTNQLSRLIPLGWSASSDAVYYENMSETTENNIFGSNFSLVRHDLGTGSEQVLQQYYGLLLEAWPERDRALLMIQDRAKHEMRIELTRMDGSDKRVLYREQTTSNRGLGVQTEQRSVLEPESGIFSPSLKKAVIFAGTSRNNVRTDAEGKMIGADHNYPPGWGFMSILDLETGEVKNLEELVHNDDVHLESVRGWKDDQTLIVGKHSAYGEWSDMREVGI